MPKKLKDLKGVNCKQLLCVLREHLEWLDNELFAWKENPEQYTVEDGPDLKSRRDELLQIFKECNIPRNAQRRGHQLQQQ